VIVPLEVCRSRKRTRCANGSATGQPKDKPETRVRPLIPPYTNILKLPTLDTPFYDSAMSVFLYVAGNGKLELFKGCELNYVLQGHAHKHLGLSWEDSLEFVGVHNCIWLPIADLLAPGRQWCTEEELSNKVLWTWRGREEYATRQGEGW